MNKREIVIFGLGLLVGYVLVKATKSKDVVLSSTPNLPDTSSQTQEPAIVGIEAGTTQIQEPEVIEAVDEPKISDCKDKWIKFAETRKFTSAEQEQNTYNNFMTACVNQS